MIPRRVQVRKPIQTFSSKIDECAEKGIRLQRVYVLPTLDGRYVFHAQFLKPQTPAETFMITSAYIMRKYRFAISDYFAYHFHAFGRFAHSTKSGPLIQLYRFGNKITTRRTDHEQFLRGVHLNSQHVT